jgi:hypothetical protein
MANLVKCLPSKCKALRSNSNITKRKERERKREEGGGGEKEEDTGGEGRRGEERRECSSVVEFLPCIRP